MKISKLTHSLLPAGFLFGLFASQQNFVLTTPDNAIVGQGTLEETHDSVVQAKVIMRGKEFTGTGMVTDDKGSSVLKKQRSGVRSDRAVSESLSMKHPKHGNAWLVAPDGAKLACEFKAMEGRIGGQCIDPDNQHVFAVKSSEEPTS